MKQYLNWSIASALLLSQSIVHAGGSGLTGSGVPSNMKFYAGASAGLSSHDGACQANAEGLLSCDDRDTGYKVFAGVRLNPENTSLVLPSLGVEGGYIDFGENKAEGDILSSRKIPIGTGTSSNAISGTYLAGVGYMPVAENTEIIGKAGAVFWNQDYERNVANDPSLNAKTSDSGVGMLVGAGVQHKFSPNLAVRGEYERALKVGKDTVNETDASLLSVGAVFSTY